MTAQTNNTMTLRQQQKLRLKQWNSKTIKEGSSVGYLTSRSSDSRSTVRSEAATPELVCEDSTLEDGYINEEQVLDKVEGTLDLVESLRIPIEKINQEGQENDDESSSDNIAQNDVLLDSVALVKASYRTRQRQQEEREFRKSIAKNKKKKKKAVKQSAQGDIDASPGTTKEDVVPAVETAPSSSLYGLTLENLEYSKLCCDFEYETTILRQIRDTLTQGQPVCISKAFNSTAESSLSEARLLLQKVAMGSLAHCAIDQSIIPEIRSEVAVLILRP